MRETARLRNAENSERFELRKAEQTMAAGALELEESLHVFSGHLEESERTVEARFRSGHWGLEPPRPLSWCIARGDA